MKSCCRPPRFLPAVRRLVTLSVIRSLLIANSISASCTAQAGEDHAAHGCAGANGATAEVEYLKDCPAEAKFRSQGMHVHGGPAKPVEGGDDQCVSLVQCLQGSVERGSAGMGSADSVVDVEVITANPSREQVGLLPVGVLVPGGYARVPDQPSHERPIVSHNRMLLRRRSYGRPEVHSCETPGWLSTAETSGDRVAVDLSRQTVLQG